MLLEYFGLESDPFGVTPEPRCLFHSRTHREALASLKYGFLSNRGFTALIASPGMGKTTLLYRFLNEVRDSARSVFLFDLDIHCEPRELIGYILRDMGIVPAANSAEMHDQLKAVLLDEARADRHVVVVIDEAQNLSDAALETVRLLSNFETPRAKLMQIILAGQPQLAETLIRPSLVQLRQRITTICRLEPLSAEETRAYVGHRLQLAGYKGQALFSDAALDRITAASRGIPRNINNLCFNALSLCCAMKRKQVDGPMMEEVVTDQQLTTEVIPVAHVPSFAATPASGRPLPQQLATFLRRRWIVAAVALLAVSISGFLGFSVSKRTPRPLSQSTTPPLASAPQAEVPTASTPPSPRDPHTPFEIVVEPHQTLRDITVQYFGDFNPARLRQIQALNPTLTNPDHIEAGQTIWLPGSTTATLAQNTTPIASARNLP